MPKKPRTPEEVEKVNDHILQTAQQLIVSDGYGAFSMRKLAAKLGVTATTIYRYYDSKEVLYLHILISGFEALYQQMQSAVESSDITDEQLRRGFRAYIDFGIRQANLYNIMMVWNVPKYYDFIGTPAEDVAKRELATALRIEQLNDTLFARSSLLTGLSPEKAQAKKRNIKCCIHGFISFYNSQITDYILEIGKVEERERLVDEFIAGLLTT